MKNEIIEALNEAYTDGKSPLTDREYDTLVDHNEYLNLGINAKIKNSRLLVKHIHPIQGLHRYSASIEEYENVIPKIWDKTTTLKQLELIPKATWTPKVTGELSVKLDGVFISAYYDYNGDLKYAITKGDGVYGKDVKEKLIWLGLPEKIDYNVANDMPLYLGKRATLGKKFGVIVHFELWREGNGDNGKSSLFSVIGFVNCLKTVDTIIKEDIYTKFKDKLRLTLINLEFTDREHNPISHNFRLGIGHLLGFKDVIYELGTEIIILGTDEDIKKQLVEALHNMHDRFKDFINKDGFVLHLLYYDFKNNDTSPICGSKFAFKFIDNSGIIRFISSIDKSVSKIGTVTYTAVLDEPIAYNDRVFTRIKIGLSKKLKSMGLDETSTNIKIEVTIVGGINATISAVYQEGEIIYTQDKRIR